MTDNEIKKAFNEYCNGVVDGYYDHISHGGKGDEHEEKHIDMICGIRDIVNRQQVENERLRDLNNVLETDVINANMNLDHIQYEFDLLKQEKSVVKTEAYKEFAEMLKHTFWSLTECDILIRGRVDALVKELTEAALRKENNG